MSRRDDIETLRTRPAVFIDSQASLRQAAELMGRESIGVAVVQGYRPAALVSERDIVAALADGAEPDVERVDSYMTLDVAFCSPHDSIEHVARLMLDNEIRHVPIVQGGTVISVISARDVLRALVESAHAAQPGNA